MPEFYEAIFGGDGLGMGTRSNDERGNSSKGAAADGVNVGRRDAGLGLGGVGGNSELGGGNSTASGGAGDMMSDPKFGILFGDSSPPQQPVEEQHVSRVCVRDGVEAGEGMYGGSAKEFTGVALQERLARLREAFAQEECRKVLKRAIGL